MITLSTAWCFDGENDVDLVITYDFQRGYAETGPTYDCGGEPGAEPECDVIAVLVNGRKATDIEFDQTQTSARLYEEMVRNACEVA